MAIGTPVNQGSAQGSAGSVNITSLANIANGDMIIGVTGYNSNSTGWTSLVDPSANTYSSPANGGTAPAIGLIWSSNVTGYNSGGTQACTFIGSASRATQIISLSGMWTTTASARDSNAVPVTTSGTSTSTTQTTGAMAQNANLLLACLFTNTNDPGTVNWGSFTAIAGATSTRFIKLAYLITTTGAPVTVPVSWTNNVAFRFTTQVFRGAAGAGSGSGLSLVGVG